MDENRVEGVASNLGGKVKDAVGGMLGDSKMQAEGKADQVQGRVQNAYGSAKDAGREAAGTLGAQLDSYMREQPVSALLIAAGVGYVFSYLIHRR